MKAFVKDNRGVTLVELMIAVIIFAIITIPLLNSFKVATMTAAKSEQMGRVSLAAQNILERIEASDVSILISDKNKAKSELQATDAKYYEKNDDTYVEVNYGNTDTHCIWLQGISSGTSSYNAMVEIDPYTAINDKELTVLTPIQLIFSQTDDDPENIVSRDIVLEVERDTENVSNVNAKISYSYEKSIAPLADDATGDDSDDKTESALPVAPDGEYTGTLEVPIGEAFSIHMLYTPVFDITDNITIKNPQNLDFDLFLVKKLREPDNKDYNCTINQIVGETGTAIDIYTNVYDSMGEGFRDGNIIITYNINGVPAGAENGLKNSLVLTQTKERAHMITVKVYALDGDFTAEPLFELKGISLN